MTLFFSKSFNTNLHKYVRWNFNTNFKEWKFDVVKNERLDTLSGYMQNVANSDESGYFIYNYIHMWECNFDTSRGNDHASTLMREIRRLLRT